MIFKFVHPPRQGRELRVRQAARYRKMPSMIAGINVNLLSTPVTLFL